MIYGKFYLIPPLYPEYFQYITMLTGTNHNKHIKKFSPKQLANTKTAPKQWRFSSGAVMGYVLLDSLAVFRINYFLMQ